MGDQDSQELARLVAERKRREDRWWQAHPGAVRAACVMGVSTFGSQAVCIKCGDECECYVCTEESE